ncbi:unnamed protein product [Angiostrongylus costaricensis]|uniref:Tyrosine-protein kinase n=1 Tax=Angiostrongylus costaricensis TaxID=334426 RepID=A0A0R3Q126_ANGCS|nr:unnamed protein product [Angiostrongylus costaricensis]
MFWAEKVKKLWHLLLMLATNYGKVHMMLRTNGDFLVRTTEPVAGKPRALVLSVMVRQEFEDQGIKHFVITVIPSGKVMIEKYAFESISSMIGYHLSKKESITKSQEVILRNPIVRQSWELSHDDVELTKKLGEGAFGEVHAGKLKLKNGSKVPVAVKLAAWGLEYLHAKNVLHRDIAARNCLYGDNKVKISDFGLTREGTVYQMDPHKRVPIRWLAPETLKMAIYTQKTDVFSYGEL